VVGRRDERAVVDGDGCRGLVLLSVGAPAGASKGRPASACRAHWIGMPWSRICPPQQRGGRSSDAARRGKGGGWIWQMAARVWADRVIYVCWLKHALFRARHGPGLGWVPVRTPTARQLVFLCRYHSDRQKKLNFSVSSMTPHRIINIFLSVSLFFCRIYGNRQDKYNFSVGRLLTDRNF
jgi:hypothetical protein